MKRMFDISNVSREAAVGNSRDRQVVENVTRPLLRSEGPARFLNGFRSFSHGLAIHSRRSDPNETGVAVDKSICQRAASFSEVTGLRPSRSIFLISPRDLTVAAISYHRFAAVDR